MKFFSDNTATACPEILEALVSANRALEKAYGDDRWTQRLDAVLSGFFGTEVRAFAVATGTAANSLSVSTLCPPYGEIYAHEEAHIARDECGAPGFYTGGAQLTLLKGELAKVTGADLASALDAHPVHLHTVQPSVVSLTQATEYGTTYRPAEIAAISEVAHRRGMKVHMDGARFANSVAFLNCDPGDITWRAGVDVLSFGATKNGAMGAEAVVFFDKELVRDFEFRRKRAGHLLSKSRYVSAQLLAYVETGVWLRNSKRTNSFAQRIGKSAGAALMFPVEANEVFLHLGAQRKQSLRNSGFSFYDWGSEAAGDARFVVSWDQAEEDVVTLCDALRFG
ncbi:MAG TPA: low specificity L-threonine aldolase [Steroidobacteraceae bacterium]